MKPVPAAAAIALLLAAPAVPAAAPEVLPARAVGAAQLDSARRAEPGLLLLRGGIFDPARQRLDYSASGAAADVADGRYALVQFAADDQGVDERLRRLGYRVVGYLPRLTYIVDLRDAPDSTALKRGTGLRWAGYYQPGMKLDPQLYAANRAALASAPQGGYDLQLFGFAGGSAQALADALAKLADVRVLAVGENAQLPNVRVNVAADQLARLVQAATALEAVSYVGHHAQPQLHNTASAGALQGNSTSYNSGPPLWLTPVFDHAIIGSGQIVSVSDSGLDANEAWFTTLSTNAGSVVAVATPEAPLPPAVTPPHSTHKVVNYYVQPGASFGDNDQDCPGAAAQGNRFHGTHVAGTIAGDAAGMFFSGTYLESTPQLPNHELSDGMAPNAQLLIQDIGDDATGCLAGGPVNDMLTQAAHAGSFIHNASWGAPTYGIYSAADALVDRGLRDNENLLFVTSAGNDGPGEYSINSPGNAKSALTVGQLGHGGDLDTEQSSSRGPTVDRRIKPDALAPGTAIRSALGDTVSTGAAEAPLEQVLSGTSMSAAAVSGAAALLRQYFSEGWYPRGRATAADAHTPTGAMLKAVLLNGTRTSTLDPDRHGWGRPWLDGNLFFSSTLSAQHNDRRRLRLFERTHEAGIRSGEAHTYFVDVRSTGEEFRATLAWYDVPANAAAATALVNDLDLEVVGPSGTLYRGNYIIGSASLPGGTANARDTVEHVVLANAPAGRYTIRVKGTLVPGDGSPDSGRQGYALAVNGAIAVPDPPPHPAPQALAASTVGNTVQVTFSDAAGAQGYQLYRARQSCAAAAPGDFHLVGTGAGSPLLDDTSHGGFTYAYTIRGVVGGVEGEVSNCVELVSSAACTLQPEFPAASVKLTATEGANCHVALDWAPGSSRCPGTGMAYRVERDTSLAFTAPTLLAAQHGGTSYDDTTPEPGRTYFYRIAGSDSAGNLSFPSAVFGATPVGSAGIASGDYADNADDRLYMLAAAPWHLSTRPSWLSGRRYFVGNESGYHAANVCAALTTPTLALRPGATRLSFSARYDLEYRRDGVVLQVSTDGGANWADLPPDGGYPSSFAATQGNACGFAPGQGAFNGVSTAGDNADPGNGVSALEFKPFSRDLSAYLGQNIKLRWVFSADSALEYEGFYLDDVSLGGRAADTLLRDSFEVPPGPGCD